MPSTAIPSAMLPDIIIPMSTYQPAQPSTPKTSRIGVRLGIIATTPVPSDLSETTITIVMITNAVRKLSQNPVKIWPWAWSSSGLIPVHSIGIPAVATTSSSCSRRRPSTEPSSSLTLIRHSLSPSAM